MAALVRDCIVCGKTFTAQRSTAKYCTSACRTRASRAAAQAPASPVAAVPAPPRREGAATVVNVADLSKVFRPPADDGEGLLATTERELREASRLNTSAGQAAMFLAQVLEVGGAGQTGSSIASLIREHRAALIKALDGAHAAEDPIRTLRQQRQQRQQRRPA